MAQISEKHENSRFWRQKAQNVSCLGSITTKYIWGPHEVLYVFAETHTFVKNGGVVAFCLHAHVFPIYRDVVVDLTSRIVWLQCNNTRIQSDVTINIHTIINLSIRTKLKLTSERVLLRNDAVYNQIFFHRTHFWCRLLKIKALEEFRKN